ncbi:peptidoglycan-binding domain-containing protein [Streptomyces griseocarneus]|uniref:peptidoglycan-binding domain-containing protein n=1 Tax=Streptomyces griseocarneus TaxID=51201 RepID=UPI00167CCF99|nr:peptidoglycan-binding domain-containing protein [Streptomyces griseocarneus]MBZ6477977.1 peptidoglycan-binding protein [Streptomyces griseocarneus]GHG54605.1 hypothetical protein GCM10018779_17700 [Streptomyces griseocarneus]
MPVRRLPVLLATALAAGAIALAPTTADAIDAGSGEWRLCPYSGGHPQIAKGSANDAVGHAQCVLNKVYGYRNVEIDNKFGPTTLATVKDFQLSFGIANDGIIGPNTWAALHP